MPNVSPGCILYPIEIWALLLSMETNEVAPVPHSPLGSFSCLVSSLLIVAMQSQKAKQKHTYKKARLLKWLAKKGARGNRLHKPGSRAVCEPYDLFSCLSFRDVRLHPFQLALHFSDYINAW